MLQYNKMYSFVLCLQRRLEMNKWVCAERQWAKKKERGGRKGSRKVWWRLLDIFLFMWENSMRKYLTLRNSIRSPMTANEISSNLCQILIFAKWISYFWKFMQFFLLRISSLISHFLSFFYRCSSFEAKNRYTRQEKSKVKENKIRSMEISTVTFLRVSSM